MLSAPARFAAHPDAPTQRPLVLVVEDDDAMRAYVCDCLALLPVRVVEAADGHVALGLIATLRAGDLALVVTDLMMPRMDGRALKAALRADRRWADVPVLLVTGEAVRVRDGPVLRKPFNARTLGASARALLNL